jgi:hypothetical protein
METIMSVNNSRLGCAVCVSVTTASLLLIGSDAYAKNGS